ncbi:hypothetical protein [Nitrospira sp. M1]
MAEDEENTLLVRRDKDGAVTLYADEDWAIERGVNPAELITVPIPRELYVTGTVQQLREHAATYLETLNESQES